MRKTWITPPEKAKELLDKYEYSRALEIAKTRKKKATPDTCAMFDWQKVVKEIRKLKTK